jgi:hypothetical protein
MNRRRLRSAEALRDREMGYSFAPALGSPGHWVRGPRRQVGTPSNAAMAQQPAQPPTTLLIACGALAREIIALISANGWDHMAVTCLPAIWHNTPDRIPEGIRAKIRENRGRYDRILVLYGDCGTGGMLDAVLTEEGVERIAGPHCYDFFATPAEFAALAEEELGTFYLTDYLARHFDRLIFEGFGLDKHPELRDMMFGNYRRVVYLAQTEDAGLQARAEAAAARLGLAYEYRLTGYGDLATFLAGAAAPVASPSKPEPVV